MASVGQALRKATYLYFFSHHFAFGFQGARLDINQNRMLLGHSLEGARIEENDMKTRQKLYKNGNKCEKNVIKTGKK